VKKRIKYDLWSRPVIDYDEKLCDISLEEATRTLSKMESIEIDGFSDMSVTFVTGVYFMPITVLGCAICCCLRSEKEMKKSTACPWLIMSTVLTVW